MRVKILLILISFGLNSLYAQSDKNSVFWKISSKQGKVSYLFGTYHPLGHSYLDDHRGVKKAFESSEAIVVETVLDTAALMLTMTRGMMPDKSLKSMVDSADYHLLNSKLQPIIGVDLIFFDHIKPVVLNLMYTMEQASENAGSQKYSGEPIDLYLASAGRKAGKEIIALETPSEQADFLFDSKSEEEQARDLVELLKEETTDELSEKLIDFYLEERLDSLYEISISEDLDIGEMDILLDNRNIKWVEKLRPHILKGNAFIAVGALHLPGDSGLINLLRKEGFKVEALKSRL